jgi:hypothetical protein
MSKQTANQRRAMSLLFLFGTIILVIATWTLPDSDR